MMRLEDCVSLLMKIKLQINAGSFVLLHNETKWLGWGSWVYWLSWALMLSEAGIEGWRGGKQCTMGRSWCCCHDNRSMHRWDGDKSICFCLFEIQRWKSSFFFLNPAMPPCGDMWILHSHRKIILQRLCEEWWLIWLNAKYHIFKKEKRYFFNVLFPFWFSI